MNRSSARLLAAALALLFVAGGDALAKDTWTSVRTRNFHLVGNAPEKEIRQVATRLEQFRHAFSLIFRRARLADSVPTTVVVFKDQDAYKPFNPRASAGYFQPGEDVNYITLAGARRQTDDDNPFGTIFHEYVHLLVKNNVSANAPAWLNEGLAEFYSTLEVKKDGSAADVGRPIAPHVYYLREQKMLPLRTLLSVDHSSPHYNERSKRGVFYAQSWALVHYLMLGNERKRAPQLSRYLQLVGGGADQQRSFEAAFGSDAEAIEKELREYIRSDRYPFATYPLGERQGAAEVASEPLTEAQAHGYLGDLALHAHLLDLAETHLQKAVALDEGNAAARASLGMLRMRQGRFDEAREHLRRAVAADARNHLAHYYYAYTLSREGMTASNYISGYPPERAAEMRAALRKAIELKPDFAGSYHLLAFVNLVTNEQLEESVALLRKAIQLAPGEEQFQLALAQVHMRREEFDAALKIVEPLAAAAPEPQTKAAAQSVLNSIRNYREQVEGYKARRGAADAGVASQGEGGPPRLGRREPAAGTGQDLGGDEAVGMSADEAIAAALREALRKPQPGETRAVGVLTRVECTQKGATFHVRVGADVLKLQGGDMGGVQFMAFTPEAGGQVGCGPRKPESRVVVTYRAREKSTGELVAVEFVPAKFELK